MSNVDAKGQEVEEVTEILIALANKLVASNSLFSSLDIGTYYYYYYYYCNFYGLYISDCSHIVYIII